MQFRVVPGGVGDGVEAPAVEVGGSELLALMVVDDDNVGRLVGETAVVRVVIVEFGLKVLTLIEEFMLIVLTQT